MKHLYELEYNNKRKPTLESDQPIMLDSEAKPKERTKGILKWSLNKEERFHT
jgi:hypothetical protein